MASQQTIKQTAHAPAKAIAQAGGGKSLPAVPVLQQKPMAGEQENLVPGFIDSAQSGNSIARFPARPAQYKAGSGTNESTQSCFSVQMKEIFPGFAESRTRFDPQKKSSSSNLAAGAIPAANGGTVQRVITNNGDGSEITDYDLDALDYYSAVFIREQVEELRVWSAEAADMVKVNAAIAQGPVAYGGGGGGGASSGGSKAGSKTGEKTGKAEQETKGAMSAERVTTFPHKGKHCPPKSAVNKPSELEAATAGKSAAALYSTNDPGTVVGWESTARASGLLLADGFTVVHKFSVNIGADQGEMTSCIRIDGDHGHPINESTGKQSFDSYIKRDIQTAKTAQDAERILVIVTWLKANGLSTGAYLKGVPKSLLPAS